ncbi:hypothetical protein LY76DRAFT_661136 [Colletotrichum caudatum]|nr:hypothetical protein LY76DRAFT_661136 [Colletotrichum caudatum]
MPLFKVAPVSLGVFGLVIPRLRGFNGYYYFISKKRTNIRLTHAANVESLNTRTPKYYPGARDPLLSECVTDDSPLNDNVLLFNNSGKWFGYSCMTSAAHWYTCVRKLGDNYVLASPRIAIVSPPEHQCERSEIQVQESPSDLPFRVQMYIVYSGNCCSTSDYYVAVLDWDGVTDASSPPGLTKRDGCRLTAANGNFWKRPQRLLP